MAWLYFAFGLATLSYGGYLLQQRLVVRGWPGTVGKMLERKVDRSPGGRAGRMGPPAYQYEALVKYSYEVKGNLYINDKIHRQGWIASTSKNRQRFLDTIPDDPKVYYNPANPQDSCLLPHSLAWAIVAIVIGALVSAIAAFVLAIHLLGPG